jgi:hypothetical protein
MTKIPRRARPHRAEDIEVLVESRYQAAATSVGNRSGAGPVAASPGMAVLIRSRMILCLRVALVRVLGQDRWPLYIVAQMTTVNRWRDHGGTGMSSNTSPPTLQPPPYRPGQPPPRKKHRVFLRVFLAIQVGFLAWVIYTGVSLSQSGPNNGVALQTGCGVLTDMIAGAIYGICQPRNSRTS